MSEILLTGIEMPKDDVLRLEIYPNGDVHRIIGWAISEKKDAKAIEVPTPHGDLIERDELPLNHITDYNLEGHSVVDIEDVLNAPTIIEASEEKR